jgi:hypothetical protein
MNTTTTKIAGEAMTDADIQEIASQVSSQMAGEYLFTRDLQIRFARALLASKAAVAFDHHEVDHGTHIELVPHYRAATAPAQSCGDAERNVSFAAEKVAGQEPVAVELSSVAETLANGGGFWRTCCGCHETEDGHPDGHYPYSEILKCDLGGGCSECGGIGAVWDNTDYGAMADAMHADMIARENAVLQPSAQSAEQCCEGLAPSHECWEECGGTKKRPLTTAPAQSCGAEQADEAVTLTPAQWADVYYFARASEIGEFVTRAQEVFDAASAKDRS